MIDPHKLAHAADGAQRWIRMHPRGVMAAILAVTAGLSASAYGIASVGPDASRLPARLVAEPIAIAGIGLQLEALADHPLDLWRSETTRASDTADSLLQRLGAVDPEAAAVLRTNAAARALMEGRPGKMVRARVDESGRLRELVARFPSESDGSGPPRRFQRLVLKRDADRGSLEATLAVADLVSEVRMAGGTIETSLFAATDAAGIPDPVAAQLADIFAGQIDFQRELRKGDTFGIVYEALTADGEPVAWNQGVGRVIAAEFVNDGRPHDAVWFTEGGKGGYFDMAGNSRRKSYLSSPLEFSRITSGFSMRLHPIFQTWRAHQGIDFAAPTGTPVRSVADGVVSFAGWQNGYGNVVQVQHTKERSTVYAHLSRIDVVVGQHVSQSQHIAAVGSTGWATGPHVHFELRVNGAYQDPSSIARDVDAVPLLSADARSRFAGTAGAAKTELAIAQSLIGTGASGIE